MEKHVVAASKSKVRAPTEQETMFKELLAKTARNARLLDRRKNTPQPRHYVKAATKAYGRPSRTDAQPDSPYKLPIWRPSPEDDRGCALYRERIWHNDVGRDVTRDFYDAVGSDATNRSILSVPLHGRSASPWRAAARQPKFGFREHRLDHLSAAVSQPHRDYQVARRCTNAAPSEGQFGNQVSHGEAFVIPPRGAYSSPGIRNRPGDYHMFRRFDSRTTAWVTDEYCKHKQQGPGYYGSPNT
ncbi:hypothetical protein HPB50_000422 [Hyalomma asiaticum]|uniref:Uncharacterized protein n=1 Tax=Hyalomma asiaticum TaxID=266040 RepID=A0ACB7RND5_HYAAI|nr:hypothetical protein HPB50_000422 [Hyalomma asiaticum]